jgi:hypothetical protein
LQELNELQPGCDTWKPCPKQPAGHDVANLLLQYRQAGQHVSSQLVVRRPVRATRYTRNLPVALVPASVVVLVAFYSGNCLQKLRCWLSCRFFSSAGVSGCLSCCLADRWVGQEYVLCKMITLNIRAMSRCQLQRATSVCIPMYSQRQYLVMCCTCRCR